MDWEYAPAPESAAIGAIKDRYLPYIDGTFVEGGGEDLTTFSPGPAQPLSTVSTVSDADVEFKPSFDREGRTSREDLTAAILEEVARRRRDDAPLRLIKID